MKVAITGSKGQLGLAFRQEFTHQGIPLVATDHSSCDIASNKQVEELLDAHQPTVLINCAAYNLVDEAEENPEAAFEINTTAVKGLARACRKRGIKFVHYSTDYVFDGKKACSYVEEDAVNPLNVYGRSKYEGELEAQAEAMDCLILRTSWVYGQGKQNFLYKLSEWAKKSEVLNISADETFVPTSVEDIVSVTLKALERKFRGLYHLTSSGATSRYEWAKYFFKVSGLPTRLVPVPLSFFKSKAVRPLFSALSNEKISKELGIQIPSWQQGVEKYVRLQKG